MRISQALVEVRRHKELTEVGAHVDGVYCLATTDDLADLKQTMESQYLFPDGSRVFQIKDEPAFKMPTYEQNVEPMRISQALVEIRRHNELTEVGAHVDGVYCLATTDNLADLKQTMESRYPFRDGSRVFRRTWSRDRRIGAFRRPSGPSSRRPTSRTP